MPQDPAAIQRDIEVTRAELAETIDAITDKVSPKRVADRTKLALTERATELRDRVQSRNGHGPPELTAGEGGAAPPHAGPARSLRWERVAVVAGAVVLLLARRRRKRRKAAAAD